MGHIHGRSSALATGIALGALVGIAALHAPAGAQGLPSLSISDVTQDEGNSGTDSFGFLVTLSAASATDVTVHYQTQDGSATTSGADYVAAAGTLTIPANTTEAVIDISVVGDVTCEYDETFSVNLSNPSGATISDGFGIGTIHNDDCLPDSSFAWFQHGFDRASDGACMTRGWTAEDRTNLIFAHVDTQYLVNDGFMTMGTKALWFGADTTSHPDEVSRWYSPSGFGSYWSQRLTSPAFTNGNYRLEFDGRVALQVTPQLTTGTANRWIAVQALQTNGKWELMNARWVGAANPQVVASTMKGRANFKCFVATHPDSQPGLFLASPLQLRIVVQTPSSGSDEDGAVASSPTPEGAAIVDNIRLRDLNAGKDPIPSQNFESGGTGVWTLSAQNGGTSGVANVIRDLPPTSITPSVQDGFDANDPSCVWTFGNGLGYLPDGLYAHLTSPWFAREPGSDTTFSVHLRQKYGQNGRFSFGVLRGKNAGDTHSRFLGWPVFIFGDFVSDLEAAPVDVMLNYPTAFSRVGSVVCDSLQITIGIVDLYERFGVSPGLRGVSKLPWFDDISILQYNIDSDHDGVSDARDLCPPLPATGQDADGNGCSSPTATLRHVESWANTSLPIHYRLSQQGDPAINDGSDLQALRDAFAVWQSVPGADVTVVEDPVTSQTDASATDGINLLTFQDDYAFPGNVLAVTPTLSFTKRAPFDDVMRLPGEIVDADIMFNPNASFRTPTAGPSGGFDLKSVAVHEIGHLLGLSHSGVADATMFPVLQTGTLAASLESDDQAAIAAAYPAADLMTSYGWITGNVKRGSNGNPVPGALVLAVRLSGGSPADTAASDYTDENGRYTLFRLVPGDYAVRILPLDGSTPGVVPGAINARVEAIAQTNFKPEWFGGPESNNDDPDVWKTLTVTAGNAAAATIVTNIDVTPPTVASVTPAAAATNQRIDTPVLVEFSESVDASTLGASFKLRKLGNSGTLGGRGDLLTPGLSFVFVPSSPLEFATDYEIQITTALKDVEGNPLASTFTSTFHTENQPPVSIGNLSPREAPVGALVTLTGTGYDASPGAQNKVYFSTHAGFAGYVLGTLVTPTSMVAEVPADAVTGPVKVAVGGIESNLFSFSLLTSQVAAPSPDGDAVSVGFPPSDVALSPDGKTAFAVGSSGLARINLDPMRPSYRVAVATALDSCRSIGLLPSGLRAYVTRPNHGDVVEVDADPLSGTFGQQKAIIALPGTPDGIAIAPSGQRAYVTDDVAGKVYELNVDASSALYRKLLREIPVPSARLSGGIGFDPRRERLVLPTTNLGILSVDLDTTAIVTTLSDADAGAGVASTPSGSLVLACQSGSNPGTLTFADPLGVTSGPIDVGGDARDVSVRPDGATALVANALLRRLQVLDVTQSTPRLVANVATGATPVAVATSGNGGRAAVANFSGLSVSFYNLVNTVTPVRVTPPVAAPGDLVSIAVTGGTLPGAASVETGTTSSTATLVVPTAAAFRVPIMDQKSTTATLVVGGVRSIGLPFQVVDAIAGLNLHATGLTLDPVDVNCGSGPIDGALRVMRVSPDGKLLAVSREGPSCGRVDVYRALPDGGAALGSHLVDGASFTGTTAIRDLAFTPDSKRLWVATDAAGLFEVDVDAESPGLGNVLPFGSASVGSARALASDPMGRYVVVGCDPAPGAHRVQLWAPNRTLSGSVTVPGAVRSLAVTPDGGYAVAGGQGRAHVVDLAAASLVGSTPLHSVVPPDDVTSVAVTTNSHYAVGLFPSNNIAIWNVDPSQGAVGSEVYFGAIAMAGTISRLSPASDGAGIFVGCSDCGQFSLVHPGASPTVTNMLLGQPSRALARSADGRTLWIADWNDGTLLGQVGAFTLGPGATLSLVSGGNSSAAAGQPLPLPVRVHLLADATGHDVSGALVRFSLASSAEGGIDGSATEVLRTTDAIGEAEITWTMPPAEASVTMNVTALGVSGATLDVTARATVDDSVALPTVLEVGPPHLATNINAGTEIFVNFSQRMVPGSVDSALIVMAGGASVGRTLRFDDDMHRLFVTPLARLPYNAVCSISIAATARDEQGQEMPAPVTSLFTVQAQPVLGIASLSPPSAPPGAIVTINGDGFSPLPATNTVSFNGVQAHVLSASAVSLVTTVPSSATTGPLTVSVGIATSPPDTFVVLPLNPQPLALKVDGDAKEGITAIAVTPDGKRAYITLPTSNSVLAYDIEHRQVLKAIPVGLRPQDIAIDPDGHYAYVANTGSDDVSVIDVDPGSPGYHHTLPSTIPVGDGPVGIVVSAFGPSVLVASGSGTISIIDANAGAGTFGHVTSSVTVGSGVKSVAVTPDGTRLYLATTEGIVVVDVASHAVTSTIQVGSGGSKVAVSPDGTLLFALLEDGRISTIDIVPGSTTFNQVTKSITVGSGGQEVQVSPDGTLLFVTLGDLDVAEVFKIIRGAVGGSGSGVAPVPPTSLELLQTVDVGQAPAGLAILPGGSSALIVNEGSGTVTMLTRDSSLAAVPAPLAKRRELSFGVHPTPSIGTAALRFSLAARSRVELEIFDLQGRLVKRLADGVFEAGPHTLTWSGDRREGGRVGPGIYFARLEAEGRVLKARVVWLE